MSLVHRCRSWSPHTVSLQIKQLIDASGRFVGKCVVTSGYDVWWSEGSGDGGIIEGVTVVGCSELECIFMLFVDVTGDVDIGCQFTVVGLVVLWKWCMKSFGISTI